MWLMVMLLLVLLVVVVDLLVVAVLLVMMLLLILMMMLLVVMGLEAEGSLHLGPVLLCPLDSLLLLVRYVPPLYPRLLVLLYKA